MNVLRGLFGVVLAVTLLFVWKVSYPYTCFSLLLVLIVLVVIGKSQFEYLYRKRACIVSCVFRRDSSLYSLFSGKSFTMIFSAFFAFAYTISLSAFTAFASLIDWLFIIFDAIMVAMLYPIMLRVCDLHFVDSVAPIIAKRLVVATTFVIIGSTYIGSSFYLIPSPDYIDPVSLKNSIDQASQTVASVCSLINLSLKAIQEANAVQWFYVVTTPMATETGIYIYLIWFLFFLNSALVFLGMGRFCVELTSMVVTNNRLGGGHIE